MILKHEQNGVWIVVQPYFNSNVLEEISVPCYKFDLPVGKLYLFVIWAVYQRIVFDPVLQENEMTVVGSLYRYSPCFVNILSL